MGFTAEKGLGMTASTRVALKRRLSRAIAMGRTAIVLMVLVSASPAMGQYNKPFQAGESQAMVDARQKMTDWLKRSVKGITPEVLAAFNAVPRHKFMHSKHKRIAYRNKWKSIGYGQTITNPWMVAYMTHLLDVSKSSKVMEIGTGSGYQSSILAQLSDHVHSVEIVRPLAERTHKIQEALGYTKKLKHKIGDGYFGWQENGPYDRIMVTCAADHIPVPLIQQLKPGGLMLIPVGGHFQRGNIYLVTKQQDGSIRRKVVATGTFVPMRRADISNKKK